MINGDAGSLPGGGVRALDAQSIISGCHIYNNRAGAAGGGGIHITNGDNARLVGNEIFSNAVSSIGVGLGVRLSDSANVLLADNRIYSNTAASGNSGGGVHASCDTGCSGLTLIGNDIYGNNGGQGGGVLISNITGTTLTGNEIHGNTAQGGGGLYLVTNADATLANNLVADNTIGGSQGAGIGVNGSEARMLHTTLARNTGTSQYQGIYVTAGSTVWMTNTIVVDHYRGIEVVFGPTATLAYTLWGTGTWANSYDWAGAGALYTGTLATNWWEDPGFMDGSGGDFHLGPGSAAIDDALPTGVDTDLDGETRPYGLGPDLGADEYGCSVRVGTTLYPTVQDGVGAATHDELVEVAGTCKGVDLMSSVAYITETLTMRGGYSHDFGAWDPDAYPTTLDAQDQGRVVYINGDSTITPTLEWLRLTNGSSSSGGGLYSVAAHPTISACQVYGNAATSGYGGGIYLESSPEAVVANSAIHNNTALSGGGMRVYLSPRVRLARNQIHSNTASAYGGGVYLDSSGNVTMTNNIVADNQLSGSLDGAGIYARDVPNLQMVHTTIACNTGGGGQGVYVTRNAGTSSVILTNTILVSHTVGIYVKGPSAAARVRATLWGDGAWSNGTDWDYDNAVFSHGYDVTGLPHFVDPDGGDYHIGADSAAIGQGVSTSVATDMDGETRLGAPDLGADEFIADVFLPLVLRNY